MNAKELAAILTGREYGSEITPEDRAAAKAAGLVIVYGASDDLIEFDGALHDELGCYEGGSVRIDTKGLVPPYEAALEDGIDALRDYFKRENGGKEIEALWDAGDGYSWTYKTEIPHETFEVMEDGEPYCRGIIFALSDASS